MEGSKMPRWYYHRRELRQSPSILKGMDQSTENQLRREGARFIVEMGTHLNLSLSSTMATASVFFHRFYMCHAFQDFPHYPTACACLFLAGKVEETPKKCRDMIESARAKLDEAKFLEVFGSDEKTRVEEMMTLERILLQSIKFDLQLDHPYKFLLKYATSIKGDKARLEKMVQMAWNFVNDSLCTTLCLQWEPEIIAIALMHLACKLSKFEVLDWQGRTSEHLRWWDMFVEDMTIEVLEDICHQVLDFYATNPQQENEKNTQASPPDPVPKPSQAQPFRQSVPPNPPFQQHYSFPTQPGIQQGTHSSFTRPATGTSYTNPSQFYTNQPPPPPKITPQCPPPLPPHPAQPPPPPSF